jgi:hypothetical protein
MPVDLYHKCRLKMTIIWDAVSFSLVEIYRYFRGALSISDGVSNVYELLPLTDIFFIPLMVHEYGKRRWNDTDMGNQRTRRKTCPSATLSTTKPTRIDPGANPGLRGDRPATNRLSNSMALIGAYCLFHQGSVMTEAVTPLKRRLIATRLREHPRRQSSLFPPP